MVVCSCGIQNVLCSLIYSAYEESQFLVELEDTFSLLVMDRHNTLCYQQQSLVFLSSSQSVYGDTSSSERIGSTVCLLAL